MSDSPIAGMAGVSDFVTNERPENWRAGLLRQEPNGDAPLTALTALMPSRTVDDELFHHWRKDLPTQRVTITGVYTNAALTTAYVSGGVVGSRVFLKMSENDAKTLKYGDKILLRDPDDESVDVDSLAVSSPVLNGASSSICVQLMEADDNSVRVPARRLNTATVGLYIGSAYPDGSLHPQSIVYAENYVSNYCQIFRDTLNLTRRRMYTGVRTVDPYQEAKYDCFIRHSLGMEKAFIWGVSCGTSITSSESGQKITTMNGIKAQIANGAPSNIKYFNFDTDTAYKGKTWNAVGLQWLLEQMELSFRYRGGQSRGPRTKLVYAGSKAILGIQTMLLNSAFTQFVLEPRTLEFGISVTSLISSFGRWDLMTHPLFSYETTNGNAMLVLDPTDLTYVYFKNSDTRFLSQKDKQMGEGGYDGVLEGYLTDCSIEVGYPAQHMYLSGIGVDNSVV